MIKYLVFVLLFIVGSLTLQAQPDPEQFLFNHVYVDVDSGAHTSYVTFSKWGDSLVYRKGVYLNEEEGAIFIKPNRSLIVNDLNPNSTIFGIHYLNSEQEDVYVYLLGAVEDNTLVEMGGNNVQVAFERMDLKQGTYFVDWSSRQTKEFQQKILEHVEENDQKYTLALDSLQAEVLSKRRCSRKKQERISTLEKEKIRYKYENDENRFLGYYRVYYERTAKPNGPYMLDNYVFVVKKKAVEQQKISDYAISTSEVIEYINTGNCNNPELAKQILESLQ